MRLVFFVTKRNKKKEEMIRWCFLASLLCILYSVYFDTLIKTILVLFWWFDWFVESFFLFLFGDGGGYLQVQCRAYPF